MNDFLLYMLGFYKTIFIPHDMHWNCIFHSGTRKKLAERMREAECEPVLEIAGVSCLVYSHWVQAGVTDPERLAMYDGAHNYCNYGIQDDRTFMDACV